MELSVLFTTLFVCHETVSMAVVYHLTEKYDQGKFGAVSSEAFDTISFPLEEKHVVNKHHIIRKSNDTIQKKCPHMVHFNIPRDWFETNLRLQKCYSECRKKKRILGCRGLLGRVVRRLN